MLKYSFGFLIATLFATAPNCFGDQTGEAVDFDTQIVPILTRYGCNSGACHGAAIGRGGFQLSLFGSRSTNDHRAIARELEGRRLNLHDPDASLVLLKATESVEHGGGVRFDSDSDAYALLRRWISSGAERKQSRTLTAVKVSPKSVLLDDVNDSISVSVIATFDDGTEEDVTQMTVLSSDDPESVSIDEQTHQLTVLRRGEHLVIARFLNQVHPIRIGVPIGKTAIGNSIGDGAHGVAEGLSVTEGLIDGFIDNKLSELRIPTSPPADDDEFARRIWLDLAGRLPSRREWKTYRDDTDDDKRARLIDRLLETSDFADYWALKWANTLAIDSKSLQSEGARAYHAWLAEQIRNDTPWSQSAMEMLTAEGDSYANGPANFSRTGNGPDGIAESATRIFMGVRLRCANCHDHPLDHWSQDDYHGLAAVFAKLKRGRMVSVAQRGEVTHPVTGQPATPRIPGTRDLRFDVDGRVEFAKWVTDTSNPYFARAAVNRIWAHLMGRGIIDPVDDIRATNPATHPKLVDSLAQHFSDNGFRFKSVIRLICNSRAYGRSSKTMTGNETDTTYYSHFLPRPLEAEVVANAFAEVTGVTIQYGGGTDSEVGGDLSYDAIRLTDNRTVSETLDVLGRCDRSVACETPGQGTGSLAKVLHFLNGAILNDRLHSKDGSLTKWLNREPDDTKLVELIYETALSRRPGQAEQMFWNTQLTDAKEASGNWRDRESRKEFFADLAWGLLSSETFLTNH